MATDDAINNLRRQKRKVWELAFVPKGKDYVSFLAVDDYWYRLAFRWSGGEVTFLGTQEVLLDLVPHGDDLPPGANIRQLCIE